MSKESYIGGDYIETTGGSAKNFAGGSIENSSLANQLTQKGQETGVTYNVSTSAPFIEFDTGIDLYIEFEPLTSYDGEFGFDWLKVDNSGNTLKVQEDDIANLEFVFDNSKQEYSSISSVPSLKNEIKKEYKQFPLKVPYYIPWLSLMQIDQELKLNMICKPIISGNDITKGEVSFGKNEFYEVTIDGQKNENIKYIPDGKPKEITIKCIKPSKEISIIAVDKNGKEIGKIIAIDNTKIFELPVRLICVVKDTSNKETEIAQLISDFKSEKIEDYLNKNSLNQALIKTNVEIDSKYRIAFDENAWNGTFYDKAGNFFTNRKNSSGEKVSYIDDDGDEVKDVEYEHILDKFLRDYKVSFETDGKKFKGILLFISNINKQESDKEGGVSRTKPVTFREAIVFASNLKNKSTYAHEIAHALGLEHYFWKDAEYKKDLDDLKNRLSDNKRITAENKRIQKSNEEALKQNKNNIKIRQSEIDKWMNEKKKPDYPYKKEAQERINQLEKANSETRKINKDIQEKIDQGKKNIEKGEIQIKQDESNLLVYSVNKYKFKEKSTLNIMDYSSKLNIFTKWQWKIMQNDVKSYYGTLTENK